MAASSAERGESVELKDRVAAPPETRVPLMSSEDIKKKDEQLAKEHKELMKDMKELSEDLNRWQKTQKYGTDVYMSAAPVVSIIMIVIGSLYIDDCTVQPYIPIYLVVAASCGIFLGGVWIYGVQDVEFEDILSENYCNKTLYYFSFWLLNVAFILLGLCLILGLCCCIAALYALGLTDEEDE